MKQRVLNYSTTKDPDHSTCLEVNLTSLMEMEIINGHADDSTL